MGRGDRAKVRWANDRKRKKHERDKRQATQRSQAKKSAG